MCRGVQLMAFKGSLNSFYSLRTPQSCKHLDSL